MAPRNAPEAATTLLPSAEQATAVQFVRGALVCTQVWAEATLAAVRSAAKAAMVNAKRCVFMAWFFSA